MNLLTPAMTTASLGEPLGPARALACPCGDRAVAAVSPDGSSVAVAEAGRPIRLYRRSNGRRLRAFSGRSARSTALAFAPDGRALASAGLDGRVRIWDLAREVERRELPGHDGPVAAVAYTADGALLATTGLDGAVRRWEADTGRLVGACTEAG